MRDRVEFIIIRSLAWALGSVPRPLARKIGAAIGAIAFAFTPQLRRRARANLLLALPEKSLAEREKILHRLYRHLGWLLAEFCQMKRYTPENSRNIVSYDGLEHYLAAHAQGKGVLILTGHLGAWELSSFYHSLMGHPMSMVIRRLDNPWVDRFVNGIRCLHGNQVLHKDDFARGILAAMRRGESVGILMDTNMTPPQGVFVNFFGRLACTASGLARVAMKTGAAVLPGFLLWEESIGRYVLRFEPPVPLVSTGDYEADVIANTALFTRKLEDCIRKYPDQWLWVHRRWKTRPEGETPVYTGQDLPTGLP